MATRTLTTALLLLAATLAGCAGSPDAPSNPGGPDAVPSPTPSPTPTASPTREPTPSPSPSPSPSPTPASPPPGSRPPPPQRVEVHNATYTYAGLAPADGSFEAPEGFKVLRVAFRLGSTSVPCTEVVTVRSPTGASLRLGPDTPNVCQTGYSGSIAAEAGTWTLSFEGNGAKTVRVMAWAETAPAG